MSAAQYIPPAVRLLGRTEDGREVVCVESEPHWQILVTGAPVRRPARFPAIDFRSERPKRKPKPSKPVAPPPAPRVPAVPCSVCGALEPLTDGLCVACWPEFHEEGAA